MQASHADLTSVDVSNMAQTTASIPELHAVPGRRQYVVVFGDQGSGETRAVLMGPPSARADGSTSAALSSENAMQSHAMVAVNIVVCHVLW